jgi:hypothetical protein
MYYPAFSKNSYNAKTTTVMNTLQEAIETRLKITAIYVPTGERVKCVDPENLTEVEFSDGRLEKVERNDLISFSWS